MRFMTGFVLLGFSLHFVICFCISSMDISTVTWYKAERTPIIKNIWFWTFTSALGKNAYIRIETHLRIFFLSTPIKIPNTKEFYLRSDKKLVTVANYFMIVQSVRSPTFIYYFVIGRYVHMKVKNRITYNII